LKALVLNKQVAITPGARDDKDRYGRLLRHVETAKYDAGRVLINEGLAVARYDSRDGYGAQGGLMASIDKRPNGRWRARWRDPNGLQKARHFRRKTDAERWLVHVEHSKLTAAYVDPAAGRTPFRRYVQARVERQPWRASTDAVVRRNLVRAIAAWGDRPIASIRPGDVQALLAAQTDLAPSTVKLLLQHLRSVFRAAVADGLIARSPCGTVRAPSIPAHQVQPPTDDQVRALLKAASPRFRVAIVLGAGLGLRHGEASGLTLDRVDFLRRTVRVDRQWLTPPVGAPDFAPLKTAGSARTIPAADSVLAELARHVERHGTGSHGILLHGSTGRPLNRHQVGAAWRATSARAGVDVRYHDLRHAFAARLIAAGCSVKAVQTALSHERASTTLDTYGHLWPGDEDRLRAALAGLLEPHEDSLRTSGPDQARTPW
jgi:integrase